MEKQPLHSEPLAAGEAEMIEIKNLPRTIPIIPEPKEPGSAKQRQILLFIILVILLGVTLYLRSTTPPAPVYNQPLPVQGTIAGSK